MFYQQQSAPNGVNPQRQPHLSLPAITEQVSTTNLYISGLSKVYTDEDLVQLCTKFGNITSTKAILDKNTNLCIGYGFVNFENPADAQNAVIALRLAKFAKLPQEQDPTNLYFSGLPKEYDEKLLEKLVKPYGKIVSSRVIRNTSGNSKGVGFCRMENSEDCKKVIEFMEKAKLNITVKFANPNWWTRLNEAPPHNMVPPTGVMGRGGLVHQSMTAPPVYGYQVPASGVSSTWQPAYYMQPASAIPGGGQVDSVLGAQLGQLQISGTVPHRGVGTPPPSMIAHGQDHSSDGHALGGEMKPHHIQVITSGNDQQQQQRKPHPIFI